MWVSTRLRVNLVAMRRVKTFECVYPTVVIVSKTLCSARPACLPACLLALQSLRTQRGVGEREKEVGWGYVNEAFSDKGRSGSPSSQSTNAEGHLASEAES